MVRSFRYARIALAGICTAIACSAVLGQTEERLTAVHPFASVNSSLPTLASADAQKDLAELKAHLEDRFSYLTLREVDVNAEFDRLRNECENPIRLDHFALHVHQFICRFGDGHAGIPIVEALLPTGCAPFLLGDAEGRLIAFREDHSGLVEPDYPYIRSINGLPVDQWISVSSTMVPNGSTAYVRRNAIRRLRFVRACNLLLGRDDQPTFSVVFESDDRSGTIERTYELAKEKPRYGEWPRTRSRMLESDIGYLRINAMDEDAVIEVFDHLPLFATAKGLIIDVRGNTGGSRDVLRTIYPFLAAPDASPLVANIAAYRLSDAFESDHLEPRYLFRSGDARFDEADRRAIDQSMLRFSPTWLPPIERFSTWHYLILRPTPEPPVRFHDRPVVVLINADVFSAADIFVGALAELPNVTLIGTPTVGGSGRSTEVQLSRSRLPIRLSSMVSYRPDGRLFDTNGIKPSVHVDPEPGYHIGASDRAFERAVEFVLHAHSTRTMIRSEGVEP